MPGSKPHHDIRGGSREGGPGCMLHVPPPNEKVRGSVTKKKILTIGPLLAEYNNFSVSVAVCGNMFSSAVKLCDLHMLVGEF
jgi:hypothetical protein